MLELGGNIGTPVLNLKIKAGSLFNVIEASSFQLSHSKFIQPNYAVLLNITNDHLDWHGSMQHYVKSKLKYLIYKLKNDFALINNKFKKIFRKKKYLSKLISLKFNTHNKVKVKINNNYLRTKTNIDNLNLLYILSKLLKISDKKFVNSMNTFKGLPHRYEIFLKKKNITFVNDSKATSFEASKFALASSQNIYWILGGLPKHKDIIDLKHLKKNIIQSYLIGKNINFFKKQLKNQIKFSVTGNLKNSIIRVLKDIKLAKKINNTVLLSPSAASFDQFKNFEKEEIHLKNCANYMLKIYLNLNFIIIGEISIKIFFLVFFYYFF